MINLLTHSGIKRPYVRSGVAWELIARLTPRYFARGGTLVVLLVMICRSLLSGLRKLLTQLLDEPTRNARAGVALTLILREVFQQILLLGHLLPRLRYVYEISTRMPGSPFTWFRGVICANQLEIFLALLHWNRGRITALFDTNTSAAGFFKYVFDLLLGLFEFNVVFLQAELVFLIQLLGLLFLLQALHVPIELLHRFVP